MGLLELILGILLVLFLANLIFAFIPVPRGIGGTIIVILVLLLVWQLVF